MTSPVTLTFDHHGHFIASDLAKNEVIVPSLKNNGVWVEGNLLQVIKHEIPMVYGLTSSDDMILYIASSDEKQGGI